MDGTFEFLLLKSIEPSTAIFGYRKTKLNFVAGFLDAEGSIYFHRRLSNPNFEISFTNTNREVLDGIREILNSIDYHPKLHRRIQRASRTPKAGEGEILRLELYRSKEVRRLLTELPMRHKEKVTKAKLALSFLNAKSILDPHGTPEGWQEYLAEIEPGCRDFVADALRILGTHKRG